jgi:hypothetical protein
VQHYQARKVKVKSSPKLDVMADGVALGKGTVKIKVRKGALRIITAQKAADQEQPQKDSVDIMAEKVVTPVGKNHRAESLV